MSALEDERSVHAQKIMTLSLVVPVFNEIKVVDVFLERIAQVFLAEVGVSINLDIVFVNDGSTDGTLEHLLFLQKKSTFIQIVDLSRNFGKEAALTAGLKAALGKIVVPIDVDLQDPPELILKMIGKWREGFDVVLGKRINRDSDSWAKQKSAKWFYRVQNMISELKIPENVGDFRLMDRAVVDALNELPESMRFMKGLFAWVGFHTTTIEYSRPVRVAGTTKFNGLLLWKLALEGLFSFTTYPLKIWTYLGISVALTSFIFATVVVVKFFVYGINAPGYASLIVSVTFIGGLQLIGIGVIGEYLGRTYIESKRRPTYIVKKIYKIKE
jgi:polyisoprenyl-phosphate glycosyltransferase